MFMMLLYVDPGSGSYLVQMIIAGVLGALFYFKGIWYRIKSFFGRKEQKTKESSSSNEKTNV